jgi:hypothetical protein
MEKKYSSLLIIVFCIGAAYSVCQEFIKPKTEVKSKKSVSEQQCVELDGDLIVCGTQLSGVLIDFSKAVFLMTQAAVTRVNDYACGEKEGLSKAERAALYAKKTKIRNTIESYIEKIEAMTASLAELTNTLSE